MTGLQGFGRATLAAIMAGAVVAATAIGWGLWRQQQLEARSAAALRSYYQVVHREQLLACPARPVLVSIQCKAAANAAAWERQRIEGNLLAQRITALWTQVMGIAAVSGMLLSAVGVALVWSTFRQSKRSADAAVQSYDAFVAAEDALLRVAINACHYPDHQNKTFVEFQILVMNHGRTSAIVESVRIGETSYIIGEISTPAQGYWGPNNSRLQLPEHLPATMQGVLTYQSSMLGKVDRHLTFEIELSPHGNHDPLIHVRLGDAVRRSVT